MSITINITISDDEILISDALAKHMAALGFARTPIMFTGPQIFSDAHSDQNQFDPVPPTPDAKATIAAEEAPAAPAKRTRRTKAEIEAEKAQTPAPAEKVVEVLEQAAVAEERAISTSPEDRKQDEADEQADAPQDLTIDRVRALAGAYVEKFGMANAQIDGVEIFTKALGPVPAGMVDTLGKPVEKWRMSVVPETEDDLRKMIHAWEEALEVNPVTEVNLYNRPVQ